MKAGKVKPEPSTRRARQAGSTEKTADQQRQVLLFVREDWTLYTSFASLPQRAGVPARQLPWLVAKELCDNALDSADAAGNPGAVQINVDAAGNLTVVDQGTGIPDATPETIASLFCVARPMLSSKLLRRPSRGAVGNGLRVCLGYLTATRGKLVIETANVRVTLLPEVDGRSRIIGSETIEKIEGLKLTAIAGDQPFSESHLSWARDAVELAVQSGEPSFTGRPSPHWFDVDHFRVLLKSAVGDISVRQFLGQFDGCTGSRAQSRIAARFLRRSATSLDAEEAAELLTAAQGTGKPPKARTLRPLGRGAVVSAAYAIAEGSFIEGAHAPHAAIPFIIECWADAFFPHEQQEWVTGTLYMNRTRALVSFIGGVWHGRIDITIGGTHVLAPVPAGPHYGIDVNITTPMFRLTSDGKQPDLLPFNAALVDAISRAAKKAGADIAEQMTGEQKQAAAHQQQQQREAEHHQRLADREGKQARLAQIEADKTAKRALPTIRDVVLELLPDAVAVESASGLPFNTRRLVYRMRDRVLQRTGRELTQGYFDDLLTEIEAENGDLSPLLYREARGNFLIPHQHSSASPLGTLTVRRFLRPDWTFNKVLLIEKDDLRYMLECAGWAERNDCLIMSSKGFSTRAARDLIDVIAGTEEPVQVFCVHDADASGTLIAHTLQHETKARAARSIQIIDLGLQPWEGVELGLPVETVLLEYRKDGTTPRRRPVADYVRDRSDQIDGETWEQWLQHARVELNAFTSAELIDWLDQKMAEHGAGKLIPPDDLLQDQFSERMRGRAQEAVEEGIARRLVGQITVIQTQQTAATKDIQAEIDRITADLRLRLAEVSEPFHQRIAAATSEANAIERQAAIHRAIARITPGAGRLRTTITEAFADRPALHWSAVLHEIAAGTDLIGMDDDHAV